MSENVQRLNLKVRAYTLHMKALFSDVECPDFGVIATNKGWNVYVGGNGGAKPRHAELLAAEVSRKKVNSTIDYGHMITANFLRIGRQAH